MDSMFFGLAAMVSFGLAPIAAKLGLATLEPLPALTLRSIVVSVVLILVTLATSRANSLSGASFRDMAAIGLDGILAALLGQLAYYYALKYGEAGKIIPLVSAFPLVGMVAAAVLLGESLTLGKMIGAIMIVIGIIIIRLS